MSPELMQNHPNPFNEKTNIKCLIPVNFNSAEIIIHNLNGLQIARYPIIDLQNGIANISINAGNLEAGMYHYTLLIDQEIIDTKKMILTK